ARKAQSKNCPLASALPEKVPTTGERDSTARNPRSAGRLETRGSSFQRKLVPRERHGRPLLVAVLADVLRTILEVGDEAHQLFDRLLASLSTLLSRRQLGLAQHAALRIAARPGNDGRRTGAEKIDVVERAILLIEAHLSVLDFVLAHVVAVKVQVHGCFQLTGVGDASGELALPPAGQEFLVH